MIDRNNIDTSVPLAKVLAQKAHGADAYACDLFDYWTWANIDLYRDAIRDLVMDDVDSQLHDNMETHERVKIVSAAREKLKRFHTPHKPAAALATISPGARWYEIRADEIVQIIVRGDDVWLARCNGRGQNATPGAKAKRMSRKDAYHAIMTNAVV